MYLFYLKIFVSMQFFINRCCRSHKIMADFVENLQMTNLSMKIFLKFPHFLMQFLVFTVVCSTVKRLFSLLWKNVSNIIDSFFLHKGGRQWSYSALGWESETFELQLRFMLKACIVCLHLIQLWWTSVVVPCTHARMKYYKWLYIQKKPHII